MVKDKMDASHLLEELPSDGMATKGRRPIGSYITVTKTFQDDIREALARNLEARLGGKDPDEELVTNQKELGQVIGHDASSISLLLSPERVGKTSRLVMKVAECLGIPLPRTETDDDARKLSLIRAANPKKYKLVHDLIDEIFSKIE